MRQSVEGLGTDLQRKGISRQAKWGAKAIVYVLGLFWEGLRLLTFHLKRIYDTGNG